MLLDVSMFWMDYDNSTGNENLTSTPMHPEGYGIIFGAIERVEPNWTMVAYTKPEMNFTEFEEFSPSIEEILSKNSGSYSYLGYKYYIANYTDYSKEELQKVLMNDSGYDHDVLFIVGKEDFDIDEMLRDNLFSKAWSKVKENVSSNMSLDLFKDYITKIKKAEKEIDLFLNTTEKAWMKERSKDKNFFEKLGDLKSDFGLLFSNKSTHEGKKFQGIEHDTTEKVKSESPEFIKKIKKKRWYITIENKISDFKHNLTKEWPVYDWYLQIEQGYGAIKELINAVSMDSKEMSIAFEENDTMTVSLYGVKIAAHYTKFVLKMHLIGQTDEVVKKQLNKRIKVIDTLIKSLEVLIWISKAEHTDDAILKEYYYFQAVVTGIALIIDLIPGGRLLQAAYYLAFLILNIFGKYEGMPPSLSVAIATFLYGLYKLFWTTAEEKKEGLFEATQRQQDFIEKYQNEPFVRGKETKYLNVFPFYLRQIYKDPEFKYQVGYHDRMRKVPEPMHLFAESQLHA
jgi:hypothetical protein